MNGLKINTNMPALSAHKNIYENSRNLSKNIERISSGLKINRGSDGPADLIISEILKAQSIGITQAIANNDVSMTVAQTVDDAMNEANQLLNRVRQLAIHASNEGSNDIEMLTADQVEMETALDSLDRIAQYTEYGSIKLMDGSNSNIGLAVGEGLEFVEAGVSTVSSNANGFNVDVSHNAAKAQIVGEQIFDEDVILFGETLKIYENGKKIEVTSTHEDTAATVVAKLNNELARQKMNVNVFLNENEKLVVTHNEYGSKHSFQVYSSTDGILSRNDGDITTVTNGRDVQGFVDGQVMEGQGEYLMGVKGTALEGLKLRFDGSRQIDDNTNVGKIFFEQNSLRFQIGGGYGDVVNFKLPTTFASSMGAGVDNESNYKNLRDLDLRSFQGAQDALLLIDSAQRKLSLRRAELGSIQRNALEINNAFLHKAKGNIINAESVIRDADLAAEITDFSRNKIKQEAGMAMLSHANKNPRDVLSLLQ